MAPRPLLHPHKVGRHPPPSLSPPNHSRLQWHPQWHHSLCPHHSTLQWHRAMAPSNGTTSTPQSWSSPSPHNDSTLKRHPAMAPNYGTTSTPPKLVVTVSPNYSTLQWHPAMVSSNGTTSSAPCNGTLVPRPIRQSGSSPSPRIGSKNPYSYRYLGKNPQNTGWARMEFFCGCPLKYGEFCLNPWWKSWVGQWIHQWGCLKGDCSEVSDCWSATVKDLSNDLSVTTNLIFQFFVVPPQQQNSTKSKKKSIIQFIQFHFLCYPFMSFQKDIRYIVITPSIHITIFSFQHAHQASIDHQLGFFYLPHLVAQEQGFCRSSCEHRIPGVHRDFVGDASKVLGATGHLR